MRDRIAKTALPAEPFRRPTGRASYPRRITLDLDDRRYQWLRATAYDARVLAAALLRAALDVLMEEPQRLAAAVTAAQAEYPPPGS